MNNKQNNRAIDAFLQALKLKETARFENIHREKNVWWGNSMQKVVFAIKLIWPCFLTKGLTKLEATVKAE